MKKKIFFLHFSRCGYIRLLSALIPDDKYVISLLVNRKCKMLHLASALVRKQSSIPLINFGRTWTLNWWWWWNWTRVETSSVTGYDVKLICRCPEYDVNLIWHHQGNDIVNFAAICAGTVDMIYLLVPNSLCSWLACWAGELYFV